MAETMAAVKVEHWADLMADKMADGLAVQWVYSKADEWVAWKAALMACEWAAL